MLGALVPVVPAAAPGGGAVLPRDGDGALAEPVRQASRVTNPSREAKGNLPNFASGLSNT